MINTDIDEELRLINRLAGRGNLTGACRRCGLLLKKYPHHPDIMHSWGLLLFKIGRPDFGERLVREVIVKHPGNAGAYGSLGEILSVTIRYEEAEQCFRKHLERAPEHLNAMAALARLLARQQRFQEAQELCDRILDSDADYSSAYGVYAQIMLGWGKTRECVQYLRKALHCRKNEALHSSLLFLSNLLREVSRQELFEESVRWAAIYTKGLGQRKKLHSNVPAPNRTLRIGYVSGDLRQHPVGFHLLPVLASHDRSQFEIYIYDTFPGRMGVPVPFAGQARRYRQIALLPDEKAEALIREDGIDILVDLSGHTSFNRLLLFARKPAPVQVTWIGYFNTTGLSEMDYLIGDSVTTPAADDAFFTEKIIRLPEIRFCYGPPSYAPDPARTPAEQNGFITFGSFNAVHKLLPEVLDLWSRVLKRVSRSRLLLKSPAFEVDQIRDDFFARCAALGITEDRLELRPASSHRQMLAEYGAMDISLDTFPYNGGVTTCEALWMGVPVITLLGDRPAGRQTAACLQSIGRQEWVAATEAGFVTIAADLASDIDRLTTVRSLLRQEMAASPVCDARSFTRHLENALRQVWTGWCAQQPLPAERPPSPPRPSAGDERQRAWEFFCNDNARLAFEQIRNRAG